MIVSGLFGNNLVYLRSLLVGPMIVIMISSWSYPLVGL